MNRHQRTAPHVLEAKRYWLVKDAKNTSRPDSIRSRERWPLIVKFSGDPDGVAKVVAARVTKRHLWQLERHRQLYFDTSPNSEAEPSARARYPENQRLSIAISTEDEESRFAEGAPRYALHRRLERDTTLARRVKEKHLAATGKLVCQVCRFDFERKYGEHGRGFIEAHHTVPVSKLTAATRTMERDLILVCSNCHRMLHYGLRLLSPEELKAMCRVET